jgi:hypothetical protein
MGESDTDAAYYQHMEIPRQEGENMAPNKQHEQANQQLTALHLTGQQHKRQRHQRHNPGVDRQHNTDLRCFHVKALRDVRQQPHGHELSGIKNERSNGKRHHPEPRDFS